MIDLLNLPKARVYGKQLRPSYIPQKPLPVPPSGSYDRDLPFTPPSGPDKLFYRGDFCGVTTYGVPLLPEMSGYTVDGWKQNLGLNPPIMSLDITRYWKVSKDLVVQLLSSHATRGYTHLQCSVGHAIAQGLSIDDYVEYSGLVQQVVGFADHWFLGGGPWSARNPDGSWNETRDRDREYWQPKLKPWFDALLANNLADCVCVGWQLDGGNTGDPRVIQGTWQNPMQSIIDLFADTFGPHNIPIGTHWLNEAGGWWSPSNSYNLPTDRFGWWKAQRGKLTWFHHQGDTRMEIPLYQSKLVDTLQPFGDGRMGTSGLFGDRPFSLVAYEYAAQSEFDLEYSEDVGCQRGYYLTCTKAASHVGGYGNGAKRPNGNLL